VRFAPWLALPVSLLVAGCPWTEPDDFCWQLAQRCAAPSPHAWAAWCRGECVPDDARVPCDANDQCLLCAADGELFGLPSDELEYLWTQSFGDRPSMFPGAETAPTGAAFDDRRWPASMDGAHVGAWRAFQPVDAALGDPSAFFCEPGPNLYLAGNVSGGDAVTMRAERLPAENASLACPSPFCPSGPYLACDAPTASVCQYRDEAEQVGQGTASQLDRVGASDVATTYGYGSYRATLRASGPTTGPVSGTVYAFFSQSSEPCEGSTTNAETNTAEIDVEISASTDGTSGTQRYCGPEEMCFIVSTWSSSTQGLPYGVGTERHETSAFRYRDRATAGLARTYGYDWRPDRVRFTYDASPHDCDEAAGGCTPERASIAICEHRRFVPHRPSPIHFQLWNAWWAGIAPPGTPSEMTIDEVWHTPLAP
jgi:hypothetical protein